MGKLDNDSLRLQYLKEYLETFKLPQDFIDYIVNPENNPAQHQYHNPKHCYTVAVNCILASDYHRLSDKDCLELIIASIFHDWGHSGGELTDSENINIAVLAYTSTSATFKTYLDHQAIIRLIRSTQYPHVPVSDLKEQLIQDADLLQYLHKDALQWIESFSNETGGHNTPEDVAEFLKKQHFNTAWGKKKAEETIKKLLAYNNADKMNIKR